MCGVFCIIKLLQKTGSAGDMERELSESPSLKRQRFSQTGTTSVVSFTSTTISSQTSILFYTLAILLFYVKHYHIH